MYLIQHYDTHFLSSIIKQHLVHSATVPCSLSFSALVLNVWGGACCHSFSGYITNGLFLAAVDWPVAPFGPNPSMSNLWGYRGGIFVHWVQDLLCARGLCHIQVSCCRSASSLWECLEYAFPVRLEWFHACSRRSTIRSFSQTCVSRCHCSVVAIIKCTLSATGSLGTIGYVSQLWTLYMCLAVSMSMARDLGFVGKFS